MIQVTPPVPRRGIVADSKGTGRGDSGSKLGQELSKFKTFDKGGLAEGAISGTVVADGAQIDWTVATAAGMVDSRRGAAAALTDSAFALEDAVNRFCRYERGAKRSSPSANMPKILPQRDLLVR